ncbi:hypothetical protein Tco_0386598 [Tanacetum coccineum]
MIAGCLAGHDDGDDERIYFHGGQRIEDIEKSVSDGGSGHLFTPRGYQGYSFDRDGRSTTFEMDEHSDAKEDVDGEEEYEKARLSGGR